MNTIIYRGINSNTIPGLLIQELPPIVKPQMRTQVTVVDGRDGDIVDTLGYNSYSKDVLIGLHGDYDIDAIAKYFSGSGELVLSNEPTKKYHVDCFDQIDFERLVRFRTATARFIAQPFKYLVGELTTSLDVTSEEEITVTNAGLEDSKPLIYLEGEGNITITLDGLDVFTIILDDEYMYIDSDLQDAYITGFLRNYAMTGDFLVLPPGEHTIGWSGTVTKIEVTPRSRWL